MKRKPDALLSSIPRASEVKAQLRRNAAERRALRSLLHVAERAEAALNHSSSHDEEDEDDA